MSDSNSSDSPIVAASDTAPSTLVLDEWPPRHHFSLKSKLKGVMAQFWKLLNAAFFDIFSYCIPRGDVVERSSVSCISSSSSSISSLSSSSSSSSSSSVLVAAELPIPWSTRAWPFSQRRPWIPRCPFPCCEDHGDRRGRLLQALAH